MNMKQRYSDIDNKYIILICFLNAIIATLLSYKIIDLIIVLNNLDQKIKWAIVLLFLFISFLSSLLSPIINGLLYVLLCRLLARKSIVSQKNIKLFKIYIISTTPLILDSFIKIIIAFIKNKIVIGSATSFLSYFNFTSSNIILSVLSIFGLLPILSIFLLIYLIKKYKITSYLKAKIKLVIIYMMILIVQGIITYFALSL
ncbi:hypothetical protein DWB90_11160 [Staphylococcus chromogenes]|nr:hypothetical protein DWB97_11190 [Staphylococcus chromogenes]QDX01513.1 hypothetical protein DWB90_11160 [Staphylococcus chromogenes]